MNSFVFNAFDNIERIDFHEIEKDFFSIVKGKIHQTNSYVANISKHHKEKVNISYFQINTASIFPWS